MMRRLMVLVLVGACVAPARAQVGDEPTQGIAPIYVRTADAELQGQLLKISDDTLTLLEHGIPRELSLADISRIDVKGDSVKNGALIGAVVLGVWCAIVCAQGLDGYGGQYANVLLINIGLGALIGAGVDGMHVGRTTIYQRPETSVARQRTLGVGISVQLRHRHLER